jgi:hypothetical protein
MAYPYSDYIKSPKELNVSSKGTLDALGKNIDALEEYVEVLTTGKSKAQSVNPLGNKYFMDTNSTCSSSSGDQERYVFINNIPDSATGENGLITGIIQDIEQLNPEALFSAFSSDTSCQKVTMDTRSTTNVIGQESRYVMDSDVESYNPCWFSNKMNPITKIKCKEGMTTRSTFNSAYYAGLAALVAVIVYRAV